MEYNFNRTMNPSFAILANDKQFVHIECRIGQVTNRIKEIVIQHIDYFEMFKIENKLNGYLQLRRFYFDDKCGTFECIVDYLTDKRQEQNPVFNIENELWIIDGQPTYINFEIIDCSFASDHFDANHRDYYSTERVIPWISEFDSYRFMRSLKESKLI